MSGEKTKKRLEWLPLGWLEKTSIQVRSRQLFPDNNVPLVSAPNTSENGLTLSSSLRLCSWLIHFQNVAIQHQLLIPVGLYEVSVAPFILILWNNRCNTKLTIWKVLPISLKYKHIHHILQPIEIKNLNYFWNSVSVNFKICVPFVCIDHRTFNMFIMFFKAVIRHVTLLNVDLTKLHYLFMQCIICTFSMCTYFGKAPQLSSSS